MSVMLCWIDDEENIRQIEVDSFTLPDVCEAVGVSYADLVSAEEYAESDENLDSYDVDVQSVYTTILIEFVSTPTWYIVGLTCDWENDN